jgi:hypothetical protein
VGSADVHKYGIECEDILEDDAVRFGIEEVFKNLKKA